MHQPEVSDAARINLAHHEWWEERIPLNQHSLYRKIDRVVRTMRPGRVLELGCASGRYLEVLRARGWAVVGVELAPQLSEYIVTADLSQPLPYDQEFDLVISVETIEHLVDTDAFLRNCSRALKPGGRLLLTTPNLLFIVNRFRMLAGQRPVFAYQHFHVRMFVWDDLKAAIERHFVIDRIRGSHVLVGIRRGRWAEIFAILGDRWPTLAAHFIVDARKVSDQPPLQ